MTVGIDFHANTFAPDKHWWIRLNRRAHLELCYRSPDTFDRARHIVKPDGTIQVNHGKMCTHESCKAACTWDSLEYRGTKLFFLSDEVCNSTNFASKDSISSKCHKVNSEWTSKYRGPNIKILFYDLIISDLNHFLFSFMKITDFDAQVIRKLSHLFL